MSNLRTFAREYTFVLPLVSVLLTMLTLPPYHAPVLIFISFVPLLIALRLAESRQAAVLYGVLFGFVFSAYVTMDVLRGFHWLAGAEIFVWFMDVLGILISLGAAGLTALAAYVYFQNRTCSIFWRVSVGIVVFSAVDLGITSMLSGFHYGSVAFVLALLPGTVHLFHSVPTVILVVMVFTINILVTEMILTKKYWLGLLSVGMSLMLVTDSGVMIQSKPTPGLSTVSIAVIQDQERNTERIFGKTVNGTFDDPYLEQLINTAATHHPDVIVYPFNPWVGAMVASGTEAHFDRSVITVTEQSFKEWLERTMPHDSIFVTWYTIYRDGAFYNEIGYWQNGVEIGRYQKQKLFPFFDYTPGWAQSLGTYSTPYDGTAGKGLVYPVSAKRVLFGSIICSEITNTTAVKNSVAGADVLMSIGSEAMFANDLPATFNYLKARMYASQYQLPVVRATKFGPSGVFDASGQVLGTLPYGVNGILFVTVPVAKKY
jgi:apolipoprotein N-acyltransferase